MNVPPLVRVLPALVALVLPACHASHAGEHAEHEEHHRIVATSPEVKEITITQQYVCQMHSQRHIDVCARAFGVIEEIPVKEGQAVKAGDVLFRVAPQLYQAKYDAELAKFNVAQQEYENTRRLTEKSVDGKSPVVSERELAIFNAKMQEAQANARKAEVELNFATVRAPFDGVIDRQMRQQGSTVKEGEILTTLSDNSQMWVFFNVPEVRDLEFMAETDTYYQGDRRARDAALADVLNRTAKIELVLAGGTKFPLPGRMGPPSSKVNNETGNRNYRADFPNPDRLLRQGQTGTILISRTVRNAVVIPQRATYEVLDKRYVYVIDKDHVVRQREIDVAHEMDDVFVLKSGLAPTDRFVLDGVRQVRDGKKTEYEFVPPHEALSNQKKHAE